MIASVKRALVLSRPHIVTAKLSCLHFTQVSFKHGNIALRRFSSAHKRIMMQNSNEATNSKVKTSEICVDSKEHLVIPRFAGTSFLIEAEKILQRDMTVPSQMDLKEPKILEPNKSDNHPTQQTVHTTSRSKGGLNKSFRSVKIPMNSGDNDKKEVSIESKLLEISKKSANVTFKDVIRDTNLFNGDVLNDLEAARIFDKAAKFYEDKREAETNLAKRSRKSAIDWASAMAMIKETECQFPSKMEDREEREALSINKPTFNVAKIIGECPSLQRLVDLGVNLSVWEESERSDGKNMEIALRLDFVSDVIPRIKWLMDRGINHQNIADIFTLNPKIFDISLDEMNSALDYLKSKRFSSRSIAQIFLDTNCKWLNYSVTDIDSRLGYFQKNFRLKGDEVRQLAKNGPRLILWSGVPFQVNLNHNTIVDGMGFTKEEAKSLLLNCPWLYLTRVEEKLQSVFDVVHNLMGYPHELILQHPSILLQPRIRLKERHLFLEKLGRNQYDPKKPNFASPQMFCVESDAEFCAINAKVPVDLYNKFLLTI